MVLAAVLRPARRRVHAGAAEQAVWVRRVRRIIPNMSISAAVRPDREEAERVQATVAVGAAGAAGQIMRPTARIADM